MIKINFCDALCVDIFKYIFHWRRTKIPAIDSSNINTFNEKVLDSERGLTSSVLDSNELIKVHPMKEPGTIIFLLTSVFMMRLIISYSGPDISRLNLSAYLFNKSSLQQMKSQQLITSITSNSAVAKRPRDASCLSVVSFNSTKCRVESFIVSYV